VLLISIILVSACTPLPLDSDTEYSYSSVKDLSQNPSTYVGQNITLKGELNDRFGGYSLEDSDGYWVWIGGNEMGDGCIERQREYNYNSQTYVVKGTWLAPKQKPEWGGFGGGFEYQYRLSCNSPIS